MLYELLYTSETDNEMHAKDLLALLEQSRRNNLKHEVTGLLLYHKKEFMQLIEGDKEAILNLWGIIKKDVRHIYPRIIYEGEISESGFSNWSMAFKNMNSINPDEIKGFSKVLMDGFNSEFIFNKPSTARSLMVIIKKHFLDPEKP